MDVIPTIVDAWSKAESTYSREVVIDALGNSGDLRGMHIINQVLENESFYMFMSNCEFPRV